MYLNDKLFHSIVSYRDEIGKLTQFKTILTKLERILLQGKILCREEIEKIYIENYFCYLNYNRKDCISLSKHGTQPNDESKKIIYTSECAYDEYVFNNISLVLNDRLLKEYEINKEGTRMLLEVQVKGNIDLKFLEAISIPLNKAIIPFFRNDCNIDDCLASYSDNQFAFLKLQKLIDLMKKYNVNVPIVDIDTGIEYKENKEYKQLIKSIS